MTLKKHKPNWIKNYIDSIHHLLIRDQWSVPGKTCKKRTVRWDKNWINHMCNTAQNQNINSQNLCGRDRWRRWAFEGETFIGVHDRHELRAEGGLDGGWDNGEGDDIRGVEGTWCNVQVNDGGENGFSQSETSFLDFGKKTCDCGISWNETWLERVYKVRP